MTTAQSSTPLTSRRHTARRILTGGSLAALCLGAAAWLGLGSAGLVSSFGSQVMAAGKDPAELSVQIDEKTFPVSLKELKEGASKSLEHNGHKVLVTRAKGTLKMTADGSDVLIGNNGDAGGLKCVVKVGTYGEDDDLSLNVSEKGAPMVVAIAGEHGATASVSGSSASANSKMNSASAGPAKDVKVQVENGVRTITITDADGKVQTVRLPAGESEAVIQGGTDGNSRVKVIVAEGGDAASQLARVSPDDDDADEHEHGKQVTVQKRVTIQKTDSGVEGTKVVVRCVGDAPAGGGDGKKVIIIRKEVETDDDK